MTLLGKCKWTTAKLGPQVLTDLESFKLSAMRQAGVRFASRSPTIALFAKSRSKASLLEAIDRHEDVIAIDAGILVADLTRPTTTD